MMMIMMMLVLCIRYSVAFSTVFVLLWVLCVSFGCYSVAFNSMQFKTLVCFRTELLRLNLVTHTLSVLSAEMNDCIDSVLAAYKYMLYTFSIASKLKLLSCYLSFERGACNYYSALFAYSLLHFYFVVYPFFFEFGKCHEICVCGMDGMHVIEKALTVSDTRFLQQQEKQQQ